MAASPADKDLLHNRSHAQNQGESMGHSIETVATGGGYAWVSRLNLGPVYSICGFGAHDRNKGVVGLTHIVY